MAENETKKDKTGIYTAIIAGIVALSTGVMTNFDKITGKSASNETKNEIIKDTVSFSYKLNKVIRDCPSDFSNLIGNKQGTDDQADVYFTKLDFKEGMSSIYITDGENPYFDILLYQGDDKKEANKIKSDIVKKVSEFFKTEPEFTEEKQEDGSIVQQIIFEKGNIQTIVQDFVKIENTNELELIISKK